MRENQVDSYLAKELEYNKEMKAQKVFASITDGEKKHDSSTKIDDGKNRDDSDDEKNARIETIIDASTKEEEEEKANKSTINDQKETDNVPDSIDGTNKTNHGKSDDKKTSSTEDGTDEGKANDNGAEGLLNKWLQIKKEDKEEKKLFEIHEKKS